MAAKSRRVFTHADFARVERHLPWAMAKKVRNAQVLTYWIGGEDRFWYRRETRGGAVFVFVDAATGRKTPAFDHERLAQGLSQATKQKVSAKALPFSWFIFTLDLRAIDFIALGKSWRFDLSAGKLEAGQWKPSDAELPSPDGRWVAFLKGPDIWVRELATGRERALTTDGEERFAYGKSPDTNLTTITWKRAGVAPPPALLWSPDSRRVLTHRLDERRVKPLHLHQSVPDDGSVRPVVHEIRVSFPGDRDDELACCHHLSIEVETGKKTLAEVAPQLAGNGSPIERGRLWWDADARVVWIIDVGRAEKWFRLLRFDTHTGKVKVVREERASTFVEANLTPQDRPNLRVLPGGKEVVWFSQEDGWAQLYLVDAESGAVRNRITTGKWVVRDVLHVDPVHRTVLFVASGVTPRANPYYRQVCLASLDGGPTKVLTPEPADHHVATIQPRALIVLPLEVHRPRPQGVSPSGRYLVETQSTLTTVPASYLLDAKDGRVIATLEEADVGEVVKGGWRWPEAVKLKAADGKTDIYGAVFLPNDFDRRKKYPVLDLIYPGPQRIQTPHHSFTSDANGMRQFLFPKSYAELGMVVVTIDGRGTPLRSKAFHDHWYGKMETAGGLADHIAALRQLAKSRPYMDLERVGITGHSGGGFASTRAMFQYPKFFKVAVASSGNHDQRGYMQQWGEKYQGLMSEGVSYAAQVNASIAHRLEGKLMLAYADMDDNVPPALTLQVVDALIKANKNFDLLVMPNHNHLSIYRDGYFIRRSFEYFLRHLVEVEVEPGFVLPGQ
ncbi:MAG: S9 family peptidase [Alphaproteobacteria bacterium]|nr:S9 family peptidase [Alphaproteobacteria bacterium]